MTFKLYQCTDRTIKLNKTLTEVATVQGTLRDTLNPLSPEIDISISSGTFYDFNYLYCQDNGKYYFVTNVYPNKAFLTISSKEDVLMTYNSEIKNLDVILSRSSEFWNLYLQDASRQTQQNQNTYILEFPESFDSYCYILTTAGSSSNVFSE